MAPPLILAATFQDGHLFAQEKIGLKRGQYQLVTSASTLSGRRGLDVYLAPGWHKRHDRFAIAAGLRYTRLNVIEVDEDADFTLDDVWHETDLDSVPDELHPIGEQVAIALDTSNGDNMVAEGSPDLSDLKPEPVSRRRRCKECGILVDIKDVDSHKADHAADLSSLIKSVWNQ